MTTKSAPQGSENTMDSEVRKITDYVFQTDMVVGEPYIKLREMITNLIAQEAIKAEERGASKAAEVINKELGLQMTTDGKYYLNNIRLTDKKGKA